MHSANFDSTISRRQAIKMMGLGAATTMATSSAFGSKQAKSQTVQPNSNQSAEIITKEIPRTKERIPVIGLVNNAGLSIFTPFSEVSLEEFETREL